MGLALQMQLAAITQLLLLKLRLTDQRIQQDCIQPKPLPLLSKLFLTGD
jgi:hypothetical protein